VSDSVERHDDIQALLRGFGMRFPWALFVYSAFGDDPARNQEFLRTLPDALGCGSGPTSVAELDAKRDDPGFDGPFNVAFTFGGLSKLGIAPDVLGSFSSEFIQGMKRRAAANRDNGRSAPECWEQPWRDGSVDIWIGIYARTEASRERQRQRLSDHLAAYGMRVDGFDLPSQLTAGDTPVWLDDAGCQPAASQAVEHFGFGDGISDPPVKGLARSDSPTSNIGGKIDEKGRWQALAAGEFLHGYLDEVGEVPVGPTPTDIGRHGTYLVLRKLSQDVDAFRSYLSERAERHGMNADELAAKLVGRTRNGAPLVQPATEDRNDFRYSGDEEGMKCPLGSHLRRTNPRDSLGFQTILVDRHRLIRRGMPYGHLVPRDRKMSDINPLDTGATAGETYPGQGLMFLALNVDIRRQFEFVQSQWINFGNDLRQGCDRDPIAGLHNPQHPKNNRIVVLTESEDTVVVCSDIPSFVETRGGDYFFLPSLHAYAAIAEGHQYQ
jgi:Dyp-type peroxidase family